MLARKLFSNGGCMTRLPTRKVKFQIFPTSYYILTMRCIKQMIHMLIIAMPWYKLIRSDIIIILILSYAQRRNLHKRFVKNSKINKSAMLFVLLPHLGSIGVKPSTYFQHANKLLVSTFYLGET